MGRGRSAISLFVRNISHRTSRPDELRRTFERYGPIKDVYIPKDYYTGEPRGFCFVQYMDVRDAEDAKRGLDRTILDGREIAVMFAEEDRKTPDEMRRREKVYSYSSSSRDRGDRRRSRSRSRSPRKRRSSRSRSRSRSKSPKRSRSSGTRSPRGGKSRSRSYSPAPKKHRASSQSPNYQDQGKDRERERDRSPVEVDPVSESSRYDRGAAEPSQSAGNGRPAYDDDE